MKIDTPKCIKCGSLTFVKNGFVDGWQRYKCKQCGYQYTKQSPQGKSILVRILASSLYLFGISKREIARIIGVTPPSIERWLKKYHIFYMASINPLEKRKILNKSELINKIQQADTHEFMVTTHTLPSGTQIDVIIHRKHH